MKERAAVEWFSAHWFLGHWHVTFEVVCFVAKLRRISSLGVCKSNRIPLH